MVKRGKGSVKRFGARYGKTIRTRISDVETKPKGKCPYCRSEKVKRKAAGIWTCGKCESTFTGKAYQVR